MSTTSTSLLRGAMCRLSRHVRRTRVDAASVVVCAVVALAGCGSSSTGSGQAVAQLGAQQITKAMINQWMAPTVGEDFYAVATHPAPAGLVSEPANNRACVAALTKIEPVPGEGPPQPKPTVANLESRCHQLYAGIRYQTVSYLVSSYWLIAFAAHQGLTVSSQELQQELKKFEAEHYPHPGELESYLHTSRRTLQQELFNLKLQLIHAKLLTAAQAHGKQGYLKLAGEMKSSQITANCTSGYIVEHCKQYKAPGGYPGRPPAVQLQEIARWRPETSHGFTGQPLTPHTNPNTPTK